ncbi:MAG: ATP-binding protein, partial [Chloroflexota bacterium]|nr:ATP-binding protein [Chloroflexota bacterium]
MVTIRPFLGNDQTVGFVHISHADNPRLRDKTNREGLLDSGDAYNDFVAVLQIIVAYIRAKPYGRYLKEKESRREAALRKQADIASELLALVRIPALPRELQPVIRRIRRLYVTESEFMKMRTERTEDLAGVGLSVESAA